MGVAAEPHRRTSVFIVGGGPVGLAMGLLLDRFGIDAVVVEKSPTTTDHPKSRGCWVRTMELFRQWGIEQAIRDRGLQDDSDMFVQVESIAGPEISRSRPEPNLGQTPAWKSLVAQDAVEEEIYRVIEHSNLVQVNFSTEFVGFEEVEDGVVAGFASAVRYVHPDKPSELWINEVGVAPAFHRRGLGKAIMARLLEQARADGCREAWVLTDEDNAAVMVEEGLVEVQFFRFNTTAVTDQPQ